MEKRVSQYWMIEQQAVVSFAVHYGQQAFVCSYASLGQIQEVDEIWVEIS